MGAGKSTLGRHLAQLLQRPFYDSDKEIERRTGADISWIFDREGEAGFREREVAMLDELTQLPEIVLATGGGAVLSPVNRRALQQRGKVIYLWTPVATQLERTRHDRNRPLLQRPDRRAILEKLLDERDPLYREVADQVISTASNNLKKVTAQILDALESR